MAQGVEGASEAADRSRQPGLNGPEASSAGIFGNAQRTIRGVRDACGTGSSRASSGPSIGLAMLSILALGLAGGSARGPLLARRPGRRNEPRSGIRGCLGRCRIPGACLRKRGRRALVRRRGVHACSRIHGNRRSVRQHGHVCAHRDRCASRPDGDRGGRPLDYNAALTAATHLSMSSMLL